MRPSRQRLARRPSSGEVGEVDIQELLDLRVAKVKDGEVVDVDAPEAAALASCVKRGPGRSAPLRQRGGGVQGGVERPRLASAVIAAVPGCGPRGRKAWNVQARLPVDAPRKRAEIGRAVGQA